jgi:hypothetical protein
VSTAGQKLGIFAPHSAKAGQLRPARRSGLRSIGEIILESMAPVPAEGIGVMSLLARMAGRQMRHALGLDHDFVIDASRRNKLKDRPN